MKLRRYCVTVMDNWTPLRRFWTIEGARRFRNCHIGYAYLYRWDGGAWIEVM